MRGAATTRLDHLLVALDFDDTITAQDCNDILLQETTGEAWLKSEAAMVRGEISRTAAFRIQFGLIHVPRERLLEIVVAAATLRDGFADFLEQLLERGARVVVVSDGLREGIERVWDREGLPPVEIYASELLGDEVAGYDLAYNPLAYACLHCEYCKGSVVRQILDGHHTVAVVGDGEGDLCMAQMADVVFARGNLREACEKRGLPYRPFESFAGMVAEMERAT